LSNYNVPNDQNKYNNWQYNAKPNGRNWKNNNQSIGITDITSKDIIKILDFDKIVSNVNFVGRKVMSKTIVMYGRKLLKKRKRTSDWKLEWMWIWLKGTN
jgi:hypothetical protein